MLTINNHSRNYQNLTYIYPVFSRRSQGLSLGINLNVNNTCNWRCKYCQVENLKRGLPAKIDLVKFKEELSFMLEEIINNNFIQTHLPSEFQRFNDIAISGNGEPTLSDEFLETTQIIQELKTQYKINDKVKTILISNGSRISNSNVIEGLKIIDKSYGELWFKIDAATTENIKLINQVNLSIENIINNLKLASTYCKTYIQTCVFKLNDTDISLGNLEDYLSLMQLIKPYIQGILLYSIARPPRLEEGKTIDKIDTDSFNIIINKIKNLNIDVKGYE